jgi:tRNA(His) 5'-end guanylyltransferase
MSICPIDKNNENNENKIIKHIIDDERIFEKRRAIKSFDEGMKLYECHSMTSKIPSDRPFIIRLNGNSYAKISNLLNNHNLIGYPNTFNKTYNVTMIKTAELLMNDVVFKPITIYTHYDEIILVFNKAVLFNNDTQKYITSIASKATFHFQNEFYKIYIKNFNDLYDRDTFLSIDNNLPMFEACIVYFPKDKEYEIMNYIIWRNSKIRNYINECSELIISKEALKNKKKEEQIEIYKSITGIDIEDNIPHYMSEGIYLKKALNQTCYVHLGGEKTLDITETTTNIWSMKVKYDDMIVDEILAKYYNNEKWQEIANKQTTKIWHMYDEDEFKNDIDNYLTNISKVNQITQPQENQNQANENQNLEHQNVNVNDNRINNNNVALTKAQVEEFNTVPIMYKLIPFWSIHMLFIHLLFIYNNEPVRNILETMIYYAVPYSFGIYYISNHFKEDNNHRFSFINYIIGGWITMFSLITITSLMTLFDYSKPLQMIMILMVYYGYYFTVMYGLRLYVYVAGTIEMLKLIE